MRFDDVDDTTLLSGSADWLNGARASALAEHPLSAVETEYPHHAGAVEGPDDVLVPSDRHPVFYGCYDWHSAVHSHWALVRGLRLVDDHPDAAAIEESVDGRLTDDAVETERAYLAENPGFERPYGWAWLLHLAAELHRWDADVGDRWRETLDPLESQVRSLVVEAFLTADRPFRVGTHGNSAFALHCVRDYATVVGDASLREGVDETARRWYADDVGAPAGYEPLGWDFLSPTLAETDLMRRVYDEDEFAAWLDGFLPGLHDPPRGLGFEPVGVADDEDDGHALHLVGLNLSRAWGLANLADAVGDEATAAALEGSAADHARAGLDMAFTDAYGGSHWLSSFACYLLTRREPGIGGRA